MFVSKNINKKIIEIVRSGGIGIIPADTIYGIVGSALSKGAVEKIYNLRKRNLKKPMIVLIGSERDLKRFGVKTSSAARARIKKLWPGKVSIILPCASKKFSYLHRETRTIAFRLPHNMRLAKLLAKTGPLVAPSANQEGKPPAQTIKKARSYFGNNVDFYLDGGWASSKPSMLVRVQSNDTLTVLRK